MKLVFTRVVLVSTKCWVSTRVLVILPQGYESFYMMDENRIFSLWFGKKLGFI
jgi:hypothetical protein